MSKAIKVLPNYSILHKQDIFITEKYEPDIRRDEQSFLSRSFERHFNERPYLHHTCYLFLTKTTKRTLPAAKQLEHALPWFSGAEGNQGQGDGGAFHGSGGPV